MAADRLPAAEFIEDVDKYMAGEQLEVKLLQLEQQMRGFKQREQALAARRARLQQRLPEVTAALGAVQGLLQQREAAEPLAVDFELAEGIFAKAALHGADSVNLWLGANVMVEYPLDEAEQLLQQQQQVCEEGLASIAKELEHVKDSITITEVSMARVFNWDVEQRRSSKAKAVAKAAA